MSGLTDDQQHDLIQIARSLVAPGKGILASDESPSTLGKRLEKHGISNTEEHRRQYRELFYTADIGQAISGAILFPEALYQASSQGRPFVECLNDQGVLVGVKVDEGLRPLEEGSKETETRGIEGLEERCREYYAKGARFAKWRAALHVPPSDNAIQVNATQLSQYAHICQSVGLVPIVEPEILIDGDHDIQMAEDATIKVISACVAVLAARGVLLEGCLLKPQMVIPGINSKNNLAKPAPKDIAVRTLRALRQCVPPAIPGIVFLSGGQSEAEATINLNTINKEAQNSGPGYAPWSLSFSFGRALQASVLELWSKNREGIQICREMAHKLAHVNGLAALGKYDGSHPSLMDTEASLQETFRGWRP